MMPIVSWAQVQPNTIPSDFVQGKMDGERDAKGNILWIPGGCCIFLGTTVVLAYLLKPDPPAQALMGKSSEYVLGYTDGYKDKARDKNATYAMIGCAVTGVIYLIYNLIYINTVKVPY